MKLVEATFGDTTGTIIVDLWEQHIPLVNTGNVYSITALQVRFWSGIKKVSTTVRSVITEMISETLQEVSVPEEEIETDCYSTPTVTSIDLVEKVERSIHCLNCFRRLLQVTGRKTVHCDRCGYTMRMANCKTDVCAKVVVKSREGHRINLTAFQVTLESVIEGDVATLSDEKIGEILSLFENLKIKYNSKTLVITELTLL